MPAKMRKDAFYVIFSESSGKKKNLLACQDGISALDSRQIFQCRRAVPFAQGGENIQFDSDPNTHHMGGLINIRHLQPGYGD